jgi:murein L,D-transpeptidase YafK
MKIFRIHKPIVWAFFIYTIGSLFSCIGQNDEKSSINSTINDLKKTHDFIDKSNQDTVKTDLTAKTHQDTVKHDLSFKRLQLNNKNPQIAYHEKEKVVKRLLLDNKIDYNSLEVFFRVIKQEQILEVWAKDRIENEKFKLIKTYTLCVKNNPDTLRGIDLLVPESFYYISKFNPDNPYFIRMEVNYPNESDKKRGRTGGDIAIHGGCFSTYCSPFTDDDIKEIYIFATEAKSKGQKNIPVHNFPFRMTDANTEKFKKDKRYSSDMSRIFNWDNMKYGFQYFEKNKALFDYTVDEKGKYLYKD